ncbi:MAG: PqqD family protein [Ilumatobacteraceae bacterium]
MSSLVLTPAPDVKMVEVDEEAILVDEGRGSLHLLNASGALVWRCFDGESTVADIATDIADVLAVPYETVLADAGALAQRLLADGLATSPDSPPPPVEVHEHADDDGCIAIPEPTYDPDALFEPRNL